MAKKMTAREFWDILEKADYPKDIWGYEGILNVIGCGEWSAMAEYRDKGNDVLANMCERRATIIHDSLGEWDEHFYDKRI